MAGGPRKFSEKIALLNQKEAEGNAAFDSIMVQVKAIVSFSQLISNLYRLIYFLFLLIKRPSGSNSGSQLDMLDSDNCITDNNHSTIEVSHLLIIKTLNLN